MGDGVCACVVQQEIYFRAGEDGEEGFSEGGDGGGGAGVANEDVCGLGCDGG